MPQNVKGMRDHLPEAMILRQYIITTLTSVFERHGFEPLQTPIVEHAGERIPAFEGETPLAKNLSALGAMPSVHKPAPRLFLHAAADSDLHIAHLAPRKVRTSDQKSEISCSTVLNW